MTNSQTVTTATTSATRRRRLTRVLTVGALAAAATVSIAVPAQAATTGYHVADAGRAGSPVVSVALSWPTYRYGGQRTACRSLSPFVKQKFGTVRVHIDQRHA